MVREGFANAVKFNVGCAVVLAGSDSDKGHIDEIVKGLEIWGIPFDVRICSAHKQPEELMGIVREYDRLEGSLVYIAVAGGTDALSGTVSFNSTRPVISCPPGDGINMSCLTNPPGSSNAYVQKPANVARFVAQMFSTVNHGYRDRLLEEARKKREKLTVADAKLNDEYARGEAK